MFFFLSGYLFSYREYRFCTSAKTGINNLFQKLLNTFQYFSEKNSEILINWGPKPVSFKFRSSPWFLWWQNKKDILPFFGNSLNTFAVRYTATWMLFMRNLFRGTSNCLTTFMLILALDEIILFGGWFIPLSQIVRKTSPVRHISVTVYTCTPASMVYLDPFSNEWAL